MKTIILDNYDSFTFNLYQYIGELDERPLVVRSDRISLAELTRLRPDRVILSPGPGRPENPAYFGVCRQVILELDRSIPLLGVCLGHQGIVHAFGGRVVRARVAMHGKTSVITHDGQGLFSGLPPALEVMRYHSLVGDPATLPGDLEVTATASDGTLMGVRHRRFPIEGIQFHPESIGTPLGKQMLANFLRAWPMRGG